MNESDTSSSAPLESVTSEMGNLQENTASQALAPVPLRPIPLRPLGVIMDELRSSLVRAQHPKFSVGDTIRVHGKIVEGNKERIQIFEGIVLKRSQGSSASATFTVRKLSFNIGVERTFLVHSPRIEKIEVVARGRVRRARLHYLRPLRGKAAKVRSTMVSG